MKKRLTAITVIGIVLSVVIFHQVFKSEVVNYSITLERGTFASPYANHEIIMRLYLPAIDSSFGWAEGTLIENGNSSKVIYWNKVDAVTDEWIDVEWIDINTVMIDNVIFDISTFPDVDMYDYSVK